MPDLADLLASQRRITGVRANFVVNSTGKFVGETGSSRDISNEIDLAVLKRLRSLSDVIVTDAATARHERYRPSKLAPIVIWSKTGNFSGIDESPDLIRQTTPDPVAALNELLRQFGSVLLETGPTLTKLIAERRLIDELKLTVVGSKSSDTAKKTAETATRELRLNYLALEDVQIASDTYFFTRSR